MTSYARAKHPFEFRTRHSLTLVTPVKARNLRELADGLRQAQDSVVYYHTHRFLQQHHFLAPEPVNDFAYWVSNLLQDAALGERLAAVDTVRFNSLGALRDAIVAIIDGHLMEASGPAREAPEGKEFRFLRAVRFSIPTPHEAWDLSQFREALGKVSVASLYLHIFEARLRPPLGVNDFSLWLERELGEGDLARKISRLDPYISTLEGLRAKILAFIDARIAERSASA